MKTSLFTIALAVATMVPVFGAQQSPATPAKPDANAQKPAATANTTKKHHKKAVKKNTTAPAAAAKPSGSK